MSANVIKVTVGEDEYHFVLSISLGRYALLWANDSGWAHWYDRVKEGLFEVTQEWDVVLAKSPLTPAETEPA